MKPTPKLLAFLLGSSLLTMPAMAQTITLNTTDGTGQTSYNTGLNWSDGLAPSSGKDYSVTSRTLRAPATTTANQNFTFAGKSLTLNSGGILAWVGSTSNPNGALTVNDMVLNGGQISVFRSSTTLTMNGNISVTSNSTLALGSTADTGTQVRNIILNSTVSGTSQLRMNASNNNPSFLTINGNNSGFSGGFLLTGTSGSVSSTLNVGHVNALGTGTITVSQGILNLNGFSPTVGGLTGANDTGNSVQNNSNTDATLTVNSASDTTYAGVIQDGTGTGKLGLTKSGSGTLILSGANTYTGTTTVTEGVLQIGNGGTTGTLGTNSNTSIASGAELRIERSTESFGYTYTGALSGSGTVSIAADRRFNFQTNDQTASGDLSFVVNGLFGINTSSGLTAVHLGELSGSGSIIRASGAGGATTLFIGGKNTDSTFSGGINATEASVEKVGSGTLTLTAANSYAGTTKITSGTLQIGNGGTGGSLSASTVITNDGTLAFNRSNNLTVANEISGTGVVRQDGSGTLTLSGNNTYTGDTTVSAGTLLVNGSLGNTAVTVDPSAVIGGTGSMGGSLSFDGDSFLRVVDINDALNVTGSVTFGSGFGIANLLGINWDDLDLNTPYTVLSTSQTFGESDIANFGFDNRIAVGSLDREAYFTSGSLSIVVIPEPRAALLGGLGLLILLRRRRG